MSRAGKASPKTAKTLSRCPKATWTPGEKPAETALREVHEETGLKATLIAKLGDIKYVYVRKWAGNEKAFKIVSFFLTKYQSGQINDVTEAMRHEVRRAYWLPLSEAPGKLSYNGERQMAEKALAYIESHPDELT